MPRVGFEPKTPVLERAKTVNASERAATVIGPCSYCYIKQSCRFYQHILRSEVVVAVIVMSSGIKYCEVSQTLTKFSEETVVSIFGVEYRETCRLYI
jgi:hypothetical protein